MPPFAAFECNDCDRTFRTKQALQSHFHTKSFKRPYTCHLCRMNFLDEAALQKHRSGNRCAAAIENFMDIYCDICGDSFPDVSLLRTHICNIYCRFCLLAFPTVGLLEEHRCKKSRHRHRSQTSGCPFCKSKFSYPSGAAMHIESGYHGVTRQQVTEAVHRLDITPSISIARRIEDTSDSGFFTSLIITYQATEASFNGVAYECDLCHRSFARLTSLNDHLNSPAHDGKHFKCPKCGKTVSVISALIQHIESGVCDMAQLQEVKDRYDGLTAQFSKLLKI